MTPTPGQPPNPYAASAWAETSAPAAPSLGKPPYASPGLTGQIRVVAILNIVAGSMEALMGLFWAGYAVLFGVIMSTELSREPPPDGPPPEVIFGIVGLLFGGMGLLCMLAGGLRILAGIRNLDLRNYKLGIVSICFGMVTLLTFYCAPFAIAMLVYGLIVYLNPQVKQAFALREQGATADQVLAYFAFGGPRPGPAISPGPGGPPPMM